MHNNKKIQKTKNYQILKDVNYKYNRKKKLITPKLKQEN